MVSILIPARNEKYLEQTIKNVLENARGEIEILIALDGYLPEPQIVTNDTRVVFYHYENSIGQRQSINALAKLAKGEYIMKLDAHCAVDEGFDVKLAADCEDDWTVVPTMYNLDVNTWKPKLHKKTNYMYISSPQAEKPFRAMYYNRQPETDKEIDDIMVCMGPCFFMKKERFWELGGCDEGHGSWGQQGIEVSCKAWLSGGSLKVNKKTWFAHWFRGDVGFPYEIKGSEIEKARAYSRDLWLNNKWEKQTRDFNFLVEKFNPPLWKNEKYQAIKEGYYQFIMGGKFGSSKNYPRWRGERVVKFPSDLLLYQEVIWQNKPDIIIECGTAFGGSALFFQDMLDITGKGKVITIDIQDRVPEKDPRITYLIAPTTDKDLLEKVREMVKDKTVMVVLDSDHSRVHVKRELHYYGPMVTPGQYIVVEDINFRTFEKGPGPAVNWFLERNKNFVRENRTERLLMSISEDGWLKRMK